jgi:HSP20 family protein
MTTLVRQSPVDQILSGIGFGPLIRPYLPAADVYVAEGTFVIELEVPGFLEKELAIEVTGRVVTITGRHSEENGNGKTFRLHERFASEFERRFTLPAELDSEQVTSTFANGVLKVLAPLPPAQVPRKVPITGT